MKRAGQPSGRGRSQPGAGNGRGPGLGAANRLRFAGWGALALWLAATPGGAAEEMPAPAGERPAEGAAAAVLELSIEEAVELALAGNRELGVRRIGPVVAGAFERLAEGEFDPELFAETRWAEENVTQVDRATQQQFNVAGSDFAGSVGVRQDLPTGTAVEVAVDQERSISDRTPEQETARVGLTLTQSLLRGFGPGVNLVAVRQARLETEISMYELRGYTEALLARLETVYWRFVLANAAIEIFEESLALARQERAAMRERIAVGNLPRNEMAAVEAEIALRRSDLIDARGEREVLRLELVRLINPGPGDSLAVEIQPTTAPENVGERREELAERLELVDLYRADIQEAKLRLEQNRLETVQTRNGLLPRLDLFISLGMTGYADTFAGAFEAIDGETYDVRAGLVFTQPLGRRADRSRDLIARATLRQAEEALANLRQLARYDVRRAVNEMRRARQQITATAAARAFQEQTVANEEERFKVGASTALQVAFARRDLLASRINEVEARVDYRIALLNLELADGTLLERRGVRIEP